MASYGRQEPGEPFRRVSVEEAAEMQRQGALVVDVRNPDEWVSGHVKDAIHIPVDNVLSEADAKLPQPEKDIYLNSSAIINRTLDEALQQPAEEVKAEVVEPPKPKKIE